MSESVQPGECEVEATAPESCDHYWSWFSPAGTSHAARLCRICHQPDPAWLNEINGGPVMTTEPVRRITLNEDEATALGEAILPLTTLVATAGMSHEVPSEAASWEASRPLFAAVETLGNRWVAEASEQIAQEIEAIPVIDSQGQRREGKRMRGQAVRIARGKDTP